MKIKTRKTKTGASVSIPAETDAEKDALTKAIMSGELMRALNDPKGGKK